MSFSTGGLFLNESLVIAGLRKHSENWDAVKKRALEIRALPFRKSSSSTRSIREIVSRLEHLSASELDLLLASDSSEQENILWLAICRAYRFVAEFAVEVVNDRYLAFRTELLHNDFDRFFGEKAEWHLELGSLSASTRNKVRQILFRMMREANILSDTNQIKGAVLTPRLVEMIRSYDLREFQFFPGAERYVQGKRHEN
jgi:Putative inner membrane protein (DUF1819)